MKSRLVAVLGVGAVIVTGSVGCSSAQSDAAAVSGAAGVENANAAGASNPGGGGPGVGGSNGGMNVLACMVMRPELFGAVISIVPLSDMYRFPQFLMASRWTEEKGDPNTKDGFKTIKKWSPYHNVVANKKYPPLLITTGYNDSRVHPMHSWKMTARMQEVSDRVFTYTNLEEGHISAAAKNQQIFDQALRLRFLKDYI